MYILQEYNFGHWNDFYNHSDVNWIDNLQKIMMEKYPDRKYRIVEVIEIVWCYANYDGTAYSVYASFVRCVPIIYVFERFIV